MARVIGSRSIGTLGCLGYRWGHGLKVTGERDYAQKFFECLVYDFDFFTSYHSNGGSLTADSFSSICSITRTWAVTSSRQVEFHLFVTLIRFDVAYYGALSCNLHHLTDYPNLWNYTRHIYHLPNVAETVKFDHIKRHYYDTYAGAINQRIIPKGPILNWGIPACKSAIRIAQ